MDGDGENSTQIVELDKSPAKKRLNRYESARITEIDIALATWLAHQSRAAVKIGKHKGTQFGPITFERDPQVVIQEQEANIHVIMMLTDSQESGLTTSISYWYDQQLEAVNCLREVLGEPRIASVNKKEPASVLRQQEKHIAALKREAAAILGYEYWPRENGSGKSD